MSDESLTIGETVTLLREHYGPPSPMPTADAFELILWENVAYLATPADGERLLMSSSGLLAPIQRVSSRPTSRHSSESPLEAS